MRFAKFLKSRNLLAITISSLLSTGVFAQLMPSGTYPQGPGGASGGSSTIMTPDGLDIPLGEYKFPNVPSFGGPFPPGIGLSVPPIGIPQADLARLGKLLAETIKDALEGKMVSEIKQTGLDMIGLGSKNKVDAVNNDVANAVVRTNKASEDVHNLEVLEKIQTSKSVCKDLAFSLSMDTDKACEKMNEIYDMYSAKPNEAKSSALMTIAKGLNSSYMDVGNDHNQTLKRVIARHEAGLKGSPPVSYYSPDRFISQNVSTFDADQVKDLKDFMFIIMPPIYDTKETDRSMQGNNVGSKSADQHQNRNRIDRALTASVFSSSLMEKMPSATGVSPYAAMREYAKTTYSPENVEKLGNSKDMTPTQLYRQMAIMKAFKAHQLLKKYEHSLQMEQIAARKLIETIDPIIR